MLDLTFRLVGLTSLKQRRSIVKGILAKVHAMGPAFAVCEIEANGGLRRARIRVAHLSGEPGRSERCLRQLERGLERGEGYELAESEVEIL
ncbi:MAG: DUF503 family protein [Candidatus Bipolaricaulota bacterium]